MKIKCLRNMIINGQPAGVGDEVDLPDGEALYLIQVGKAARVEKKETAGSKQADKREKRD